MRKLIFIMLALASLAFSQTKYLHVSTIPGNADIYVGNRVPDYSRSPEFTSPAFIPVEENQDNLLIAVFKPEFADTLINVTLSAKDTSYLIISLKQSYDNELIEIQQDLVAKRSRRKTGHHLMWSSLVPLAVSAVSASVTLYEQSKVEDAQKILKNSKIATGEKYQEAKDEFSNRKSSFKTARNVTLGTLVGGAVLLSAGFILSF